MKGSRALMLALAMTAGVVALLIGLRGPSARLAAEHWREQLDSVPDRRAAGLLERIGELGRPGIPVLVEALGSPRESVARAAKDLLCERLSRWQADHGTESARSQADLAAALAARAGQFGPTARADAVYLATRILTWLPNSRAVDRNRVIGSCEDVFRAVREAGGLPGDDRPIVAAPVRDTFEPAVDADLETDLAVARWSSLPGGGLPIDLTPQGEPPPPQPNELRMAEARERPSGDVNAGAIVQADPLRLMDRTLPEEGGGTKSTAEDQAPAIAAPYPPIASHYGSPHGESGELTAWETVDLMQQLQAGDRAAGRRAESELARRGFSAVHLELARRLFDPDPVVRRQLARMLPSLQSVDAAPWLLQLGRDADAGVRLTAITLMATTGDPALLARAEEIARQDSDPRIRRQVEVIARQRGGSR